MSSNLTAEPREQLGSRPARKLRAAGRVPASIQGEGKPNSHVSLVLSDFEAARRRHESLFDVEVKGGGTETVMIRELSWDSMGEMLNHIEFRRVVRGVELEAEVEIHWTGVAKGGALQHLHDRLLIRAIPSMIPDALELSKEIVNPGEPLHARDVPLPEGVSLAGDPEMLIATIAEAAGMDAEPEEEGEDLGADEVPTIEKKPEAEGE